MTDIPKCNGKYPSYIHVAKSYDGSGQCMGITKEGQAYTWGNNNALGQLGRNGKKRKHLPALFSNPSFEQNEYDNNNHDKEQYISIKAFRGYAGGTSESGHTAILDTDGRLWMTGCDRWQQLGLGSSSAGSAGYTWKALWHTSFQCNSYIADLMEKQCRGDDNNKGFQNKNSEGNHAKNFLIRDVALGGDHTLVLASNQKDVFSFGKGSEGQLGLIKGKPFVSAPVHAKQLSIRNDDERHRKIGAVCAIHHCSLSLDEEGHIIKSAGKCMLNTQSMAQALDACILRSKRDGLIQ
mmetsp:Transcript_17690/g.24957  ORF Transcript_17690/g.24957 Transcript_17690/m.24957 type:complete len:294 (-) Transcript_17690:110-991(-)